MSFTRNIALAGTLAVALLASSAAPADSARPVAVAASASTLTTSAVPQTFSAQSVLTLRLTPADMTGIQGDGLWGWIKKTVKKAVTWVQRNWGTIERIYEILQDIYDLFNQDDGQATDTVTTDNYERHVTADLVYDEAGNLVSSSESATDFVYINTTVTGGGGGGGGGGGCDSGCELMY